MITPIGTVKKLELHLFVHLETSLPESLLVEIQIKKSGSNLF